MFFVISSILFVLGTIFWIWMLIAAATRERSTGDKVVWVIIILLTHIIGAVIYYFVRYSPKRRLV